MFPLAIQIDAHFIITEKQHHKSQNHHFLLYVIKQIPDPSREGQFTLSSDPLDHHHQGINRFLQFKKFQHNTK